jgi:Flp pilus assembly protein TadG
MLEFALIVPLFFAIIGIIVWLCLLFALRVDEHQAAYDAARHVAKSYTADVTSCKDLSAQKDARTAAQEIINDRYNQSWLMKEMADKPTVDAIGTGPKVGGQTAFLTDGTAVGVPAEYYCPMAVTVTTHYFIHVPGSELIRGLTGGNGPTELREVAIAARLQANYDP